MKNRTKKPAKEFAGSSKMTNFAHRNGINCNLLR